ncbi:MAG: amidohydrolase family protein, partial [Candidatus Bipolaricaulota bacterium]
HCEMAREDQIEKMGKLGLIASTQPNYIGKWGLPGSMYESRFSREKLAELNRFRMFKDKGVRLAFGSDGMPFDPLFGIHWAVNTPFDSQRLSPESAIKAYTRDAAFVGGLEKHVGSIEPGKFADFVLLDGDPIEEPDKIKDMDVEMTFMEGKLVHSSG